MTATAPVILPPGALLGGFCVADVIGTGGMGIVYRARQLSLDREVALKVLSPELAADEGFAERFRAEGMHAARLDHPNVISVYDAGEVDGRLFLAMRLVEGMSLGERLRASPLTAAETLEILRPIADGLDAAHAIGLIHRDVKPQNILLAADGHPYLADFGVAKGVASAGLTASGGFVGTLNYAAPEQILGLPTQPATDEYALAAVLFHCLTGRVPYPRETQAQLMFAQINQAPPRVPLPEAAAVNDVIGKGMAKDPADRFAGARELISAADQAVGSIPNSYRIRRPPFSISPVAETLPSAQADPFDSSREMARGSRGRRAWMVAAAVVIVAVIAAGFIALLGGGVAVAHGRMARAGPVAVSYSSPWKVTREAFAASSLKRGTAAGVPATVQLRDGLASLAAGVLVSSATVPGGPPPSLVKMWGHPNRADSSFGIGAAAAVYRWTNIGLRAISVRVIPTATGDLAVICSAPVGMDATMRSCEALAGRARFIGVTPLPVGPDTTLADSLNPIVTTVAAGRSDLATMFRGHPNGQVSIPNRLAAQELQAAGQLRQLRVPARYARGVSSLVSALGAEARRLTAVAHSITSQDHHRYARASSALTRADEKLLGVSDDLQRQQVLGDWLTSLTVPGWPVVYVAPPPSTGGTGSNGGTGSGAGTGSSGSIGASGGSGSSSGSVSSSGSSPKQLVGQRVTAGGG